jgi:uncharacterized protein (TIGR02246 family)
MAATDADVRELLDRQAEAMRAKDLDRLMPLYSADVVYFDVVPPLQYVGAEALRGRFTRWFDGFEGPVDLEVRDVNVAANGDIAVAHWFSRARGTLKNGREVGIWVRVTNCVRRSTDGWRITHEHVSAPVDLQSETAVMDLMP